MRLMKSAVQKKAAWQVLLTDLNSSLSMVLFPLPLAPTTAQLEPAGTLNETPCRMGESGRYLNNTHTYIHQSHERRDGLLSRQVVTPPAALLQAATNPEHVAQQLELSTSWSALKAAHNLCTAVSNLYHVLQPGRGAACRLRGS
jgi:hypothetical protein